MKAEAVADALRSKLASVEIARRMLPEQPGIYAWWAKSAAIPGVPRNPHPDEKDFDLFYVGIAPRERSSATLQSRVLGNHISGNTGSSTFRYVLAALLVDTLDLHPYARGKKFLLPQSENTMLNDWQRDHLAISWVQHERPWDLEDDIIQILKPPLNSKGNASHEFFPTVKAARASFREKARQDSR